MKHKWPKAIVTSIFSFLLFTALIAMFSNVSPDDMVSDIFGLIYEHANEPSQTDVISKLSTNCAALLSSNQNEVTVSDMYRQIKEFCDDPAKMQQLAAACPKKEEYKKVLSVQDYYMLEQTCITYEKGDLQMQCTIATSQIEEINISGMYRICQDYQRNKITKKEFFQKSIGTMVPKDLLENNEMGGIMNGYNLVLNYSIILTLIFLILLVILYYKEWISLTLKLGGIMIYIGLMIIIPFIIVQAYILSQGLDTSFILNTTNTGMTPELQSRAMGVLIPIIILKTYTTPFLVSGISLFVFGLTLKIMFHRRPEMMNPHQANVDEEYNMIEKDKKRGI